jgi:enoyl-CoA hydratase/carnithine racemase
MSDSVEVRWGPVTVVRLNRPERRNALDSETIAALQAAWAEIGARTDVDVVILTAAGDRAFCAGADLAEVAQCHDVTQTRAYFSQMAELIEAIRKLPQPVIGAVFGYTLAGGMGLAAGVDLLIAADDTRFGLPEVKVGLYPMVVTAPIMRLIGPRRTLELGLTGQLIDAHTAAAWGFVNRVVPRSELEPQAWALAEQIRQGSGWIARLGKEGWRLAQDMPLDAAMACLKSLVTVAAVSDDAREGLAAFEQKRSPNWPSRSGAG